MSAISTPSASSETTSDSANTLHWLLMTEGFCAFMDMGPSSSRFSFRALATPSRNFPSAAELLAAQGVSIEVVNARFAKPLDEDLVCRLAKEHEVLLTVEEGAIGGFATQVMHNLIGQRLMSDSTRSLSLIH